jgi:hypothetical protein
MPNVIDYAPWRLREGNGPRRRDEDGTAPLAAADEPTDEVDRGDDQHDIPLAPDTPHAEIGDESGRDRDDAPGDDLRADRIYAYDAGAPQGGSQGTNEERDMARLAALLASIRRDSKVGEPPPPPPAPARRAGPPPLFDRPRDSDVYIDGLRVPRSLRPSYLPPPPVQRTSYLQIFARVTFACLVAAAVAFAIEGDWHSLTRRIAAQVLGAPTYGGATSVAEHPKAGAAEFDPRPANAPARYSVASAEPILAAPPAERPPAATTQEATLAVAPPASHAVPVERVSPWPSDTPSSAAPNIPPVAVPSTPPIAAPSTPSVAAPSTPPVATPSAPPVTPPTQASASPAQPLSPPHPRPAMGTQEIKLLLEQGKQFTAVGDVVTARIVLQRVADADVAAGALALAETFDPAVLAKQGVRGVQGDADQARHWYERARELGSDEATHRLALMESSNGNP